MKDSRFITPIIITAVALTISLTACAPYRPAVGKAARCNQLNSQLVFTGSTSNTRQANIQNAEEPMVAHSYEKDNCS